MLGPPELDSGLQVGSHQSRVELQNHLPQPAGHITFCAAQDMAGFWTVSAHCWVELLIRQHPQVLLLRATLSFPVFMLGIASIQVQDVALDLVELHEVHTGPPLKPVKVPLDGKPSSNVSTAPHSLVSSANLLRMHSISLSRS